MRFLMIFMISSSVFASNFSGYNFGLSLGAVSQQIDLDLKTDGQVDFPNTTNPTFHRSLSFATKAPVSNVSAIGDLSIGWGHCYSCFYLGLIAAFNLSGGNLEQENSSLRSQTEVENDFLKENLNLSFQTFEPTIDFKFGYIFCNNLLYGIVGYAYNNLHIKAQSEYFFEDISGDSDTIKISSVFDKKQDFTLSGLRLGAGFEHLFCNYCSIFTSYTYTCFSKKTFSASGVVSIPETTPDALGSSNFSAKMESKKHLFSFGLRFYW